MVVHGRSEADGPGGDAGRQAQRRLHVVDRIGAAGLVVAALVVVLLVNAGVFDGLGVVTGGALTGIAVAAGVGVVVGVARRPWQWWATWGIGIGVSAAAAVAVAAWWISSTQLVTEHYPASFVFWVWLALWAVGVALTGWWSGALVTRVARVLTAPVAILAAFLLINAHYGYWPTVAALLNRPVSGQVSGATLAQELGQHRVEAQIQGLAGQYGPVDLPGTAVGFDAAQAYLWLPPDYFHVPHANLQVLLMLPGWPGDVQDWTRAGRVTDVADAWARAHGGLAPVMLFIDENGALARDTECVNSPQGGNAETYLTQVVPHFLTTTLGIRDNPRRWGIVGFSEGGTCAVGLSLEHPGIYGRFVDVEGDLAPGFWGGPKRTLLKLFGNSVVAERAHTPLVLLAEHRYPHIDAWFGAGSGDALHVPEEAELAAAAARAGVHVHHFTSPGGHSWTYAQKSFVRIYPALLAALGGSGPSHGGTYGSSLQIVRTAEPAHTGNRSDKT